MPSCRIAAENSPVRMAMRYAQKKAIIATLVAITKRRGCLRRRTNAAYTAQSIAPGIAVRLSPSSMKNIAVTAFIRQALRSFAFPRGARAA